MPFKICLFLFLFVVTSLAQAFEREQVMIVVPNPEQTTIFTFINLNGDFIGMHQIMDERGSRRNHNVSESEFRELWSAVNSEPLTDFEYEPDSDENMVHPNFYTLVVFEGQYQRFMRVPFDTKVEILKRLTENNNDS